jgi:hypothetical protein
MTAKWISGTLQITPESVAERDALLMIWNIRKDYHLPIDPRDFGVKADGFTDDTKPTQAVLDALVSL